jgi:hypothetical protein
LVDATLPINNIKMGEKKKEFNVNLRLCDD